jgi:SAM-dependent methyltransferase
MEDRRRGHPAGAADACRERVSHSRKTFGRGWPNVAGRVESGSRPIATLSSPASVVPWKALLRRIPGYMPLRGFVEYLVNPRARELRRIARTPASNLFQPGGRTAFDRYTVLFSALRDQLEDSAAPRVLSFGCAVGDELLSLRHYLPRAVLTGIDINRHSLRIARGRLADPAVSLVAGGSLTEAGVGQFDAIVCLSVLQRSEILTLRPDDCSPYLRFDQYERTVEEFDRHLIPGGLLLLYHTTFRFSDLAVADRYEPLLCLEASADNCSVPYGRNNRLMAAADHERLPLYRKRAAV